MGRFTSSKPRDPRRRARPVVEGLEPRWVPSSGRSGLSVAADQAPAGGVFSSDFQQFRYTTPAGTRVLLQIVGKGSLEGTTVDQNGALHLLFSKTNSYTKIMSDVHGGTGRASLASVYNRDMFLHGGTNSLSGIGASLIGTINLPKFDLINGGVINAAAGINTLGLNTVGANTQISLREIPQSVSADTSASNTTTSAGVTNSVISNTFLVQTLAGSDGEFVSAGNILNTSTDGNPGPPPAPPGVVIKVNHINGSLQTANGKAIDPQTDVKIFGYDPTTGQVHRFSLDLNKGTGAADDAAFAPIQVVGSPAGVSLSLGRDGNRQVLLVSAGTKISVYDATYGTSIGSFTTTTSYDSLASTDTITVGGSTSSNTLQMIDVAASLKSGKLTPPADNPSVGEPTDGLKLLQGMSGLPGSNRVYSLVKGKFDTLQPVQDMLGLLTTETSTNVPQSDGSNLLVHRFSTVGQKAFTPGGAYVPIPNPTDPQLGSSMGSVDRSLAVNTVATTSSGTVKNTVVLYGQVSLTRRGSIVINYPNQLSDLSESFRPDVAGSAIIDVQGNIQSVRGLTANGLLLNNAGNLNLIKIGRITNSTIIGEPVTHVQTQLSKRSNVSIISTARVVGTRNGVKVIPPLQQIGPLSQPNDSPNP